MTFYRAETRPGDRAVDRHRARPDRLAADRPHVYAPRRQRRRPPTWRPHSSSIVAGGRRHRHVHVHRRLIPPPGQLLLSKVTFGGTGAFDFTVDRSDGSGPTRHAPATTTEQGSDRPGRPAVVRPSTPAATGSASSCRRASRAGRWRQDAATCNAVQQRTRRARRGAAPTEVTVSSDAGQACLFRNTFIPAGAIAITKQTRGAGGTTGFVIDRVGEPARQWIEDRDHLWPRRRRARPRRQHPPAAAGHVRDPGDRARDRRARPLDAARRSTAAAGCAASTRAA